MIQIILDEVPGGPGGGTPDFKFEGMIEWGQIKSNPKKSLGQNINPQNPMPNARFVKFFFRQTSERLQCSRVFKSFRREVPVKNLFYCIITPRRFSTTETTEFTQQDDRKKRTAKRLRVTNVTKLLLACFDVIFA